MGAPSLFKPEYVEQARKLCELGATDREVAAFFEVNYKTLWDWRQAHPELASAMKVGKVHSDERVVQSLYRRATGYTFDAEKIMHYEGREVRVPYVEHVPPDTVACIFWLKNRRPEEWRDVKAVEHSGAVRHEHVSELSDAELERIARTGSARVAAPKAGKKGARAVH